MKQTFFTPGPSQLFPTVKNHIHEGLAHNIGSISHRSELFQSLYSSLCNSLQRLFGIPQEYSIFVVSSGTEAMERIIQNCVDKKSYHFFNGTFSKRFYQTAIDMQKQPEKYEVAHGQGYEMERVSIKNDIELICMTHNETSTGVMIPEEFIYNVKRAYPDLLLAIDIVSSVPYVALDYKKIDIAFFSVQKGFGLPAGLGVIVLSPRAIERASFLLARGKTVGASYRRFTDMKAYAARYQTKETPNVFAMYLLGKVLDDLNTIGIEKIRKKTDKNAAFIYDIFKKHQKTYETFVQDPMWQSKTVLVAKVSGGSQRIIQEANEQGFVIGSGYGEYKKTHIRIANFPAHSTSIMRLLGEKLSTLA